MAIVIIIMIVVGGLIYKGGSALTNPKLWIALIAVVLTYFGLAHVEQWEPFAKSGKKPNANGKTDPDLITASVETFL